MADLAERIEAEEENVKEVLESLPNYEILENLSELELAGTAALLHSIYGGSENILKQALLGSRIALPDGASWHRDLLVLSEKQGIIGIETGVSLRPYMAFRHFFSHAYALELDPVRMEMLVRDADKVVGSVKKDVALYIQKMNSV